MTREWVAIGTVIMLLASNLFGLLYSMMVLKTKFFEPYVLQIKSYQKSIFSKRMPLFLLNFILLLVVSGVGAYFLFDLMEIEWSSWWVIGLQVLFAFVLDDIWFYFYHKWLHDNKFMLKHIHSIHHRAIKPFPLEYLYGHPLEWMMGMIGVVIAFAIILIFMPINLYAFWIFGLLRNLHEIHIHSNIELPLISKIPLLSKTKHHDDHHAYLDGNYASTFVWMDRIFKTNFNK